MEWYFTENLQEKRIGNFKTLAYILPLVSHKCSIFKAFFINQQTLSKDIQIWINEYIHENGCIKQNQVVLLRQELASGNGMTQSQMINLFHKTSVGRIPTKKVTLTENQLYEYFPPYYTSSEMERVIVQLLTEWKEGQADDDSEF